MTTAQHIDFFTQQARVELEQKAIQAVERAMLPGISVPIVQAVKMMEAYGDNPGRFIMQLEMKIEFNVAVEFREKK